MSPSQWCLCTNAFSRALTFTGQIYKEIIAVRVRFLHRGFVRYLCQVTPFCLCVGGLCVERFLRTVFSTTQESIFQYYNSKFSWWWTCAELEIIIIIMEGNTTVTRGATTQMGNGQRAWLRWGQVLTASSTLKWENFVLGRNAYNVFVWQIQTHKPHSYH